MSLKTAKQGADGPSFLSSLANGFMRSISRHERIYLALAMTVFVFSDVYKACTTPLWFDEFMTLFISRLNSLPEMLKAMPADGQPPLQYVLTHYSIQFFGQSELSIRLPELIAYAAAGLLTYCIVRAHASPFQSIFALSIVMTSFVSQQAYTARPYGLLLAFTALTFASWQSAIRQECNRFVPLLGVTVGIAGSILSHHFGIVHIGLLLAAGETLRLMERRRIDYGLLVAVIVGLLPLALTLTLAHQSHIVLGEAVQHSTRFPVKPTLGTLRIYLLMVPLSLLGLLTVVFLLACAARLELEREDSPHSIPCFEWGAAIALCSVLPIEIALTYISGSPIATRYAIGVSLGLAIIVGWGLPLIGRSSALWRFAMGSTNVCYVLLFAINLAAAQLKEPIWETHWAERAISPLLLKAPDDYPIVIANAFDYAAEWWYSPPKIQSRLLYLGDPSYAVTQQNFLAELSLDFDKEILPLPVVDYSQFVDSHREFLLLDSGESQFLWNDRRLYEANWKLEPVSTSGRDRLYLVHR